MTASTSIPGGLLKLRTGHGRNTVIVYRAGKPRYIYTESEAHALELFARLGRRARGRK